MTTYYHGTNQIIQLESKEPFFLYEDARFAQSYATGYVGGDNHYLYEVEVKENIKELNLDTLEGKLVIDHLMKNYGLMFEDDNEFLVTDSYEKTGSEIYGYDVDLSKIPELKEGLINLGYQIIKSSSVFENFLAMSYAVLDSNICKINKISEIIKNEESDEYELVPFELRNKKSSLKP